MRSKFPIPLNPNRLVSLKSPLQIILNWAHQILPRNGDPSTTRRFNHCTTPPGDGNGGDRNSESIDAGCSIRKQMVSLWPGMYHSPVTNALWEARSNLFENASTTNSSSSNRELVSKTPEQSRTSVDYKFSDDYVLREQYRNPWNEIRMGKLVEDLDALAGTISYKHCSGKARITIPLMLVTASVDRITLKKPIRVDADLSIVGAVTWVGRSSMEIQMEVIQASQDAVQGEDPVALVANFTFVARDSETGKAAPINSIYPETERERRLWEEAEARNKMRRAKRAEKKSPIENRDADRIKALMAEGRIFSDMPALADRQGRTLGCASGILGLESQLSGTADRDSILIRSTGLQSSIVCQPQQRNIHGRIFGGFLMRKAFELAFATAYTFAGRQPAFVEVDHVDFVKPVDVGNFLRMKSCVLYTELENPVQPMINIEVVANVTHPELRSSEVSNKFYFTFTIRPEAMTDGLKIRHVVPETEEEARRVIERTDAENSNCNES